MRMIESSALDVLHARALETPRLAYSNGSTQDKTVSLSSAEVVSDGSTSRSLTLPEAKAEVSRARACNTSRAELSIIRMRSPKPDC